jgi:hypothetical protein
LPRPVAHLYRSPRSYLPTYLPLTSHRYAASFLVGHRLVGPAVLNPTRIFGCSFLLELSTHALHGHCSSAHAASTAHSDAARAACDYLSTTLPGWAGAAVGACLAVGIDYALFAERCWLACEPSTPGAHERRLESVHVQDHEGRAAPDATHAQRRTLTIEEAAAAATAAVDGAERDAHEPEKAADGWLRCSASTTHTHRPHCGSDDGAPNPIAAPATLHAYARRGVMRRSAGTPAEEPAAADGAADGAATPRVEVRATSSTAPKTPSPLGRQTPSARSFGARGGAGMADEHALL